MAGPLGTQDKGGVTNDPKGSSAPQNTAVGSGSRPGNVKMPIETSTSGVDAHTQGRAPAGWLK